VRVDSAVEQGSEITAYYDPMIAKLVGAGRTREQAIQGLRTAVANIKAWPVRTNAGFLKRCLDDPDFIVGDVDTALIARRGDELTKTPPPSERLLSTVAQHLSDLVGGDKSPSPWRELRGFRV